MSEVTHGRKERYSLLDEKTALSDVVCSYDWAWKATLAGKRLGLYVDGWKTPWPVTIGEDGLLHARCPTASSFVNPMIVPRGRRGLTR
jgi:hypothetical protein